MTEKAKYRPVKVVGVGDSYDHGNCRMVAVIYKAPLAPRGQGLAMISPLKLRLPLLQHISKNKGVAPNDQK